MSDTPKIQPALTASGWGLHPSAIPATEKDEWWGLPHGIAARCLYGQSFGFTREDVEALRDNPARLWREEKLRDIADRVEALLPPEKPQLDADITELGP